jgi:hypothetical protein
MGLSAQAQTRAVTIFFGSPLTRLCHPDINRVMGHRVEEEIPAWSPIDSRVEPPGTQERQSGLVVREPDLVQEQGATRMDKHMVASG